MFHSDMTLKALNIMFDAHKNDRDKAGAPYVFHPFQVAQDMDDEDSTCAALLHDVIEDHPELWDFAALRAEGFSDNAISALKLLTHSKGEDYMRYVERIATNETARKVKLADLRQNMDLTRLGGRKPPKYELYKEAYERLMQVHVKQTTDV